MGFVVAMGLAVMAGLVTVVVDLLAVLMVVALYGIFFITEELEDEGGGIKDERGGIEGKGGGIVAFGCLRFD